MRHQLIQQSVIKTFYHRHRFASSDETRSQSQQLTLVVFLLPTEAAPVLLLNLFPRLHPVQLSTLNKVTSLLYISLSKAAPELLWERNCRTGTEECEFLLEGKGTVTFTILWRPRAGCWCWCCDCCLGCRGWSRGFRYKGFKVPRPGVPRWSYRQTESTSSALSSTPVTLVNRRSSCTASAKGKKHFFFLCLRGAGHWSEEKRQGVPKEILWKKPQRQAHSPLCTWRRWTVSTSQWWTVYCGVIVPP